MYLFLFFLYYIHCSYTWGLLTIYRHTLYLFSLIYCLCMFFLSPTLSCVVSFLSLYTCFLLFVCNLLCMFHTKMLWWVLFKVFQKYRLSKSTCHKLSSCKVSRVCVRIDFIVFNKWIWVEWFMTSLICSFVCCDFVMDFQRGRLLGHMRFTF